MVFSHSVVFSVFFFKQKTAYEMRISDWSSDVCSSDLFANTRRIFDRGAAILDAGLVPCVGLLGAVHRKADRAAVADRRRLAVDRCGDEEQPAIEIGRASCRDRVCQYV